MKKLLLLTAITVFTLTSVNAQEFKAGVSAGLPNISPNSGESPFALGIAADASYLFGDSDGFQYGPAAGYNMFLGKTINDQKIANFNIISLAGAGRYNISEEFTVGLDLGLGFVSSDGVSGSGVFFAPRVQYGVSDSLDIVASYKSVSDSGVSFTTIGAGVEISL